MQINTRFLPDLVGALDLQYKEQVECFLPNGEIIHGTNITDCSKKVYKYLEEYLYTNIKDIIRNIPVSNPVKPAQEVSSCTDENVRDEKEIYLDSSVDIFDFSKFIEAYNAFEIVKYYDKDYGRMLGYMEYAIFVNNQLFVKGHSVQYVKEKAIKMLESFVIDFPYIFTKGFTLDWKRIKFIPT